MSDQQVAWRDEDDVVHAAVLYGMHRHGRGEMFYHHAETACGIRLEGVVDAEPEGTEITCDGCTEGALDGALRQIMRTAADSWHRPAVEPERTAPRREPVPAGI